MSFLKTGFSHFQTIEDEVEKKQAEREARGGDIFRFWMKPDKDTRIIFLTGQQDGEDIPIIEEHNLKLNGQWGNTFTCLKAIGEECPLCDAGDRPSTVGFLLVIDRSEYTSKSNGKTYKDNLKVYPATFGTLKTLKKIAAKSERGLKGVEFEVGRSSSKAARCGDQFQREAQHDGAAIKSLLGGKGLKEALKTDSVKEFWEKYLAPKSKADIVVLVSQKQTGTGEASKSGLSGEEDVDFED